MSTVESRVVAVPGVSSEREVLRQHDDFGKWTGFTEVLATSATAGYVCSLSKQVVAPQFCSLVALFASPAGNPFVIAAQQYGGDFMPSIFSGPRVLSAFQHPIFAGK
jgi:hypothetical protein